jgi:long-chain fatty acid transport protein
MVAYITKTDVLGGAVRFFCAGVIIGFLLSLGPPVFAQGIALRGVSAIGESMAGVGTACPIDAANTMHWNPAAISGLPSSEVSFSMEMILPASTLSSSVKAGSFGHNHPTYDIAGSTSSEPGVSPVPSMAFVSKDPDSPWTYGLGMYAIAGSSVNYSASLTNPILTPQPPNGYGLGRLSANVEIYQIAPTLSYQCTEHLAIGFAPTLTMGRLFASPLFLGPQNDADGNGYATWSTGVGTRLIWGGGFQVGAYYTTDTNWQFGASIKSPQWMEPFRYKSEDSLGRPMDIKFRMNYPMIASIGVAYTGFDRWLLACDVRYFDYTDTDGFRNLGFSSTGALRGIAWNSIMAVAFGAQRELNERWTIRGGYCFNENPIGCNAVQYNVASPVIIQHTLQMGFTRTFPKNLLFTVAYAHGFENSVTGPMYSTTNVKLAGTSVTSTTSADVLSMEISKRF